ncbi:MAG: serine/threonine protein kinase [Verrucomicrobia bacterium]|nr:serine/threonine protein kinase [Verrucomicrobiota bacterium]
MAIEMVTDSQYQPAHKPGTFGRFYLQELINCGGMAEIWLATDDAHKPYAMRLLRSKSRFDFTTRKRFLRGCEILSKIHQHEFVIRYHEHGKIDGTLYLLMEYLEGSNLKLLAANNDSVIQEFAGNILIDMAVALEHVHDSGFMHLDFKPENVLVSRNGNVRLVDFDLAQPIPKKPTKQAKNPGTPAYMAPEQLLREPFDHRVDIFAFGVSAYELLTGCKPFPGDSPDEVLRMQLDRHDFLAPRQINSEIPIGLEKAILKCLEREADRRYSIASLLVHDLESILYVE